MIALPLTCWAEQHLAEPDGHPILETDGAVAQPQLLAAMVLKLYPDRQDILRQRRWIPVPRLRTRHQADASALSHRYLARSLHCSRIACGHRRIAVSTSSESNCTNASQHSTKPFSHVGKSRFVPHNIILPADSGSAYRIRLAIWARLLDAQCPGQGAMACGRRRARHWSVQILRMSQSFVERCHLRRGKSPRVANCRVEHLRFAKGLLGQLARGMLLINMDSRKEVASMRATANLGWSTLLPVFDPYRSARLLGAGVAAQVVN